MPIKGQEIIWSKELKKLVIKLYNQGYSQQDIYRYITEEKGISHISESSLNTQIWRLRKQGKIKGYNRIAAIEQKSKIPALALTEQKIYNWLKTEPLSIGEMSRRLDRSKETIIKTIEELRKKGYDVKLDDAEKRVILEREKTTSFKPLKLGLAKNYLKIGGISDMHIGSKYQQMTLLHTAYKEMEREKIDFCVNAGDLTDGIGMYRGHEQERFLHGADEMVEYAIANYPKSDRFDTYIIGGNHDESFKRLAGFNIVRTICDKRKDLKYRGEIDADFNIKKANIKLLHPTGGVAYAQSYKPQKIIESIVGEMMLLIREMKDVNILLNMLFLGHYHVPTHLPSYFGVEGIGLPCFQSQTPYLRAKGLAPIIGYVIIEVWLNDKGNVVRIKPDFRYLNDKIKKNDY
jgi:biotin operon repressor/predicted phosphodiesterase